MNEMYARVLEAFADRVIKDGSKGNLEADAAFALLAAEAGASPQTIADAVSCALALPVVQEPTLDDIFAADRLARIHTREAFLFR